MCGQLVLVCGTESATAMNEMSVGISILETAIGMGFIGLASSVKQSVLRWLRYVLLGLAVVAFLVQQIVELIGFRPLIPHFSTIILLVMASIIASNRWNKSR